LNKKIEADIDPHKQDKYSVKLTKGQFAAIRLYQKNVGLLLYVYDPLDSLIQIVDENLINQYEIVNINASMTGNYTVKVTWNMNKPLSGQYDITLYRIEETGKTTVQKMQQLFDSWYEKNAPGAAVVILKNNQPIFKQVKGLANVEENIPLTSNSVFEMASCSKQFTAFAVAMLVDRKQLSLEDDIRKYLPEMPDYGTIITIANLVYHTSGIRSTDLFEMAGFTPEDIITLPMTLKFAARQKRLRFKPGERFDYSNTNYNLLAEIVARVTKQSFSAWTKENIFRPLGMNATFFKEVPGHVYAHKVLCYKRGEEGFIQRPNNWASTGPSGVCTSLDDLVKWVNSFDTKQLITKNMETLLTTTGTLNYGTKTHYAFGNEFRVYQGHELIEHLGLVIGYRTGIVRFPGQKLAMIYLSNDDNDATYQRYYKFRDMLLPGITGKKPSLAGLPKVDEVLKRFEEANKKTGIDFTPYTGTYFSEELFSAFAFRVKEGRLVITHPRMNDIVLTHTKDDRFGFVQVTRDSLANIISVKVAGEIEFTRVDK
jgi:CubicO group peptidase (beta-lactamase class C family)